MAVPFLNIAPQHEAIRAEVLAAVAAVYDGGWYVLGAAVEAFERTYAAQTGVAHCIGVGNGLDALTLSLRALGVGPGDEVIVPSNTYVATWLAASHIGARPVPVEPDPLTYTLDPARVAAAITPRTRALLPVHLYGQACPMDALLALAAHHDLRVVEDNAQAHGAAWAGRATGSFGHANATSFYPTKNLGALGDAGAITTHDPALARRLRSLRNYGTEQKYISEEAGVNSRLDELHAAVLNVKLRYLAEWTAQRRQIAAWYDAALSGVGDVVRPATAPGATHVYHLYAIRTARRDALQAHLTRAGIGTLVHYPVPPHRQPAYAHLGYGPGALPIAEELAATSLSLPLWPGMTADHVAEVAAAIRAFF